jgi:hypothetical protein
VFTFHAFALVGGVVLNASPDGMDRMTLREGCRAAEAAIGYFNVGRGDAA